jgi:UDP-glucose/GDP-mannose dehydrogenase family, NAD binding domain
MLSAARAATAPMSPGRRGPGPNRASNNAETAVAEADAVFIAVGTPSRRGDGHADLGYVHTAAREIAAAVSGFTVVVTKSTVPVGTGDEVERIISETRRGGGVQCGISARGGCCGGACTEKPWPHSLQVRSRHNLEPRGSCERCGIITVA